jgi:hypothetical protein
MSVHDLNVDCARSRARAPVSRETAARLDRFVALLLKWQEITHLIASSTVLDLWTRHIAVSLQPLDPAGAAKIRVDAGTAMPPNAGRARIPSMFVCWCPDSVPCRSTTSMSMVRARSLSRLFHVKQPRGSIAWSGCCGNGRRSPI